MPDCVTAKRQRDTLLCFLCVAKNDSEGEQMFATVSGGEAVGVVSGCGQSRRGSGSPRMILY